MTAIGWLQIALIFALVLVCVKPLGVFMARLFSNEHTFLTPVLGPVERGFYRLAGIDPEEASRAGSPIRWPCWCSTPPASSCSMG